MLICHFKKVVSFPRLFPRFVFDTLVGWCGDVTSDAEQGAESVEWVETAI